MNYFCRNFQDMQTTNPEIEKLKRCIEENLNRRIVTSTDFIFLSDAVWDRTHETISSSTLKRLWGYVKGYDNMRATTLNVLARFLGYNSWDDFLDKIGRESNSDPVLSPHVNANDLTVGDHVKVSWMPNRRCTFRYLGEKKFIIEKAENSKLKVGDTFYCDLFILHEPLYMSRLIQSNNPPIDFAVGNKGGLCELEVCYTK